MLNASTSLQLIFGTDEYSHPLDAAFNFIGGHTDRDIIISAVDENWPIPHVNGNMASLDPFRVGLLIAVSADNLAVANEALAAAMLSFDFGARECLWHLEQDLIRGLGAEYRVKAYFPPRVLAQETGLHDIRDGEAREPAPSSAPARSPAMIYVLLEPPRTPMIC